MYVDIVISNFFNFNLKKNIFSSLRLVDHYRESVDVSDYLRETKLSLLLELLYT